MGHELLDDEELAHSQDFTDEVEELGFADADQVQLYEHYRIPVDGGQQPDRVDVFLANRIKNLSRSRIKNAALAGFIRVNDQAVKVSYKVRPADVVSITLPYPPAPDLKPEPVPLTVTYEDEDLLIIHKQPGLVCHPGVGNYNGTLINGLLYYFAETTLQLPEPDRARIRPGLVHRIDKDTSGLLVIAKHELAFNFLAKQFFDHSTQRVYYALVWGNLPLDSGTITGNIIRDPADRKRFKVSDDPALGRHAVTHYRVLQRFHVCTLVECKLETGRTHQIRVHFKSIGHTLFNDRFYGGNRLLRDKPGKSFQRFVMECFDYLPRQALHAKTLGFNHPRTQQPVFFDSLLPTDFSAALVRMAQFMRVALQPEVQAALSPVQLPSRGNSTVVASAAQPALAFHSTTLANTPCTD